MKTSSSNSSMQSLISVVTNQTVNTGSFAIAAKGIPVDLISLVVTKRSKGHPDVRVTLRPGSS